MAKKKKPVAKPKKKAKKRAPKFPKTWSEVMRAPHLNEPVNKRGESSGKRQQRYQRKKRGAKPRRRIALTPKTLPKQKRNAPAKRKGKLKKKRPIRKATLPNRVKRRGGATPKRVREAKRKK